MNARDVVVAALLAVAPEIDPAALGPDTSLRDDLGLDSLDTLGFVVELSERCGVDVPERDYAELATVASATAYVEAHS